MLSDYRSGALDVKFRKQMFKFGQYCLTEWIKPRNGGENYADKTPSEATERTITVLFNATCQAKPNLVLWSKWLWFKLLIFIPVP